MGEIHYTITSTDSRDYSTIKTSLIAPPSYQTDFIITGLTTLCSFMILERDDYIGIQFLHDQTERPYWGPVIKFYSPNRYNTMDLKKLVDIFSSMIPNRDESTIEFVEWSANRFCIRTTSSPTQFARYFRLADMSYRMKIVTGFYNETFPIIPITIHKIIGGKRDLDNLILSEEDYIVLNTFERYQMDMRLNILSNDERGFMVLTLMKNLITDKDIEFQFIDEKLEMFSRVKEFDITYMSEGIARFTGFEVKSRSFQIHVVSAPSAGYYQLTPILYLTSNIGQTCFCYQDKDCSNQKILMRINNHFIAGHPIVTHNFDFSSRIQSNALSEITFKLVDANFQPVNLLSPMYLSAIATPVDERQIEIEMEK
jgi:hypothetical protein